MNIVKLKDIILTEERGEELGLTPEQVELFNNKFRDKYVYAVNWKYLIPLDELTNPGFAALSMVLCKEIEEAHDELQLDENTSVLRFSYLQELVDHEKTEKANRVVSFVEANKFSSDSDITLDEVKKFRTWLATVLYTLLVEVEDYDIVEMLNYYRLEMNDDTIKHLTHFTPKSDIDILNTMVKSTCGCQGTTGINLLGSITTCDPIYLYRKAVYEKMVETFSDISFWTEREDEFLLEVKKYIDAIIHHNLPLYTVDYVSDLYDCGCLSDANASQERLMEILKKLSIAFGYMANGEISGKRNFIGDTLNQWAAYLYERMRWY